jgi:hypothetical protein
MASLNLQVAGDRFFIPKNNPVQKLWTTADFEASVSLLKDFTGMCLIHLRARKRAIGSDEDSAKERSRISTADN